MGRRLPDDPAKRRLQLFKRIYQHLPHFYALMESGEMGLEGIVCVEGEDIYLGDLMIGIDTLPARQRQAFELICLKGYTESAATAIMLPDSKWSTPVQQYSDMALVRMVEAYEAKQRGTWDPSAKKRADTKVEPASATSGEERAHAARQQDQVRGGLQPRGPGERDPSPRQDRSHPSMRQAGLPQRRATHVAV